MPRRTRRFLGVLIAIASGVILGTLPSQAMAAGTLTVAIQGKGDVTGDGIDCDETGGDCSEFYANECEENPDPPPPQFCFQPTVTVTAGPDRSGYTYQGWTGCDSVDGSECTETVSSNRTVTANFADVTNPNVSGLSPASGVWRGTFPISASATRYIAGRSNGSSSGFAAASTRSRRIWTLRTGFRSTPRPSATARPRCARRRSTRPATPSSTESTITIDNTAPNMTVNGPSNQTFGPGTTQSWSIAATDAQSGIASVQCSVHPTGQPTVLGSCSGGSAAHSVSNLPDGSYVLRGSGRDGAGNQSATLRHVHDRRHGS